MKAVQAAWHRWRQAVDCSRTAAGCVRRLSGGEVDRERVTRFADSSGLGPKKFYKDVTVKEVVDGPFQGQFVVELDGKPLKTEQRNLMAAPTEAFAVAAAAEWDMQADRVRPSSMPVNNLLMTSLDIVDEFRPRSITSMMRFIDTDTVCFRTDYPTSLADEQRQLWDPVIKHVEERYGIRLATTHGINLPVQPPELGQRFRAYLEKLEPFRFAALESAIATTKSFAIGIALQDGFIGPLEALHIARCDEDFQARVWGEVEGGHDVDRADQLVRLAAASMVFRFADLAPQKFKPISSLYSTVSPSLPRSARPTQPPATYRRQTSRRVSAVSQRAGAVQLLRSVHEDQLPAYRMQTHLAPVVAHSRVQQSPSPLPLPGRTRPTDTAISRRKRSTI